jgi:DNA-binding transcriptional LysR family regulator
MRIEQLRYLTAVEEHGTLRRAGERLPLSQPALVEALTKLERELGTRLLDRERTGTRISDDGRHLLPQVREVLDAVDRLRLLAREGAPGPAATRG